MKHSFTTQERDSMTTIIESFKTQRSNIESLEEKIGELLMEQNKLINNLDKLRNDESILIESLREKYGKDIKININDFTYETISDSISEPR